MADDYVARIRSVQPSGPYQLIGWSFGGVVAHAMATRLQHDGERVSLLAMLDAHLASPDPAAGAPGAGELELADDATPVPAGLIDALLREHIVPEGLADSDYRAILGVVRSNLTLAREHTPEEFSGDVHYFVAANDQVDLSAANSWAPFVTGRVEAHKVACEHHDMTQPGPLAEICAVLAGKLQSKPISGDRILAEER
jgi:thioesterase domain-containing protein